jgi:type IX secretion system substrate protein
MKIQYLRTLVIALFFTVNLLAQTSNFEIVPVGNPIVNGKIEVGKYEKLELKLLIDPTFDSIQSRIDEFVSARIGDLDATVNMLNPFMEWDIDAQAIFIHDVTGKIKKVDGFYNNEYTRKPVTDYNMSERTIDDTNGEPVGILGDSWESVDVNNTGYFHFRIALDLIENWDCYVRIVVSEEFVYEIPVPKIHVVESTNKGFMKVGKTNRFFTIGDETFNPIGQNLVYPGSATVNDKLFMALFPDEEPPVDPIYAPTQESYASSLCYDFWDVILDRYAENGGNYYRILLSPQEFDIEFELLGNYYNRLHYAQEIDNTVEHAEENDLKIHFCMEAHFPFEYLSPYMAKDWSYDRIISAYDSDEQLGLGSPVYYDWASIAPSLDPYPNNRNFLQDESAIKYWKQRLRYIISRWGYSTAIGAFQLFSEINNIGQVKTGYSGSRRSDVDEDKRDEYDAMVAFAITNPDGTRAYNPYKHNPERIQANVDSWHTTMADYIKEDLDHKDHLICASYTGWPGSFDRLNNPSLNFFDQNHYVEAHRRFYYLHLWNKYRLSDFDKPHVNSEYGFASSKECFDIEYQRDIWMGAMMPTAGSFPWAMSSRIDMYEYLGKVKSAIEEIEFDDGDWESKYLEDIDYPGNSVMQCAYWNKEYGTIGRESIGIIDNRSVNFLTKNIGCPDPKGYIPDQCTTIVETSGLQNSFIYINTSDYSNSLFVDYYNPLKYDEDNDWGYISTQRLDPGNDSIILNYPETNIDVPFILFKVYPYLCNENDIVRISNINSSDNEELVLNGRCLVGGAFRSINLENDSEEWVEAIRSPSKIGKIFDGWFDKEDKLFYANVVNSNPGDEIILVNRTIVNDELDGDAIMVVSPEDGTIYNIIEGDESYVNFMGDQDHIFVDYADKDEIADLIMVNTNYNGEAIKLINLLSGDEFTQNHPGPFSGWMDSTDYVDVGDVNGDGHLELIMVNTSNAGALTEGVLLAVQIDNGDIKAWFMGDDINLANWISSKDRWLIGDVNNDTEDDLILINATQPLVGGAILALDITSAQPIASIMHGGNLYHTDFNGWFDDCDRIMLADRDGSGDQELVLVNMDGKNGFIRVIELDNSISMDFIYNYSSTFDGWIDIGDRLLIGNVRGNSADELVFVADGYDYGAFLSFDFTTGQSTIKWHNNYNPSLVGWKDGYDESSNVIQCEKSKSQKNEVMVFEKMDVVIHPNPSNGIFNISIIDDIENVVELSITNLFGIELINRKILPHNSNVQIDLSMYPKGTYIATFKSNEKFCVESLIKID